MQQKQANRGQRKSQVKIEFTPKSITSWGGTAALISRYLDKIGFRDLVENIFPVHEKSNNSTGVYSKIIAQFISVLNGGTKFSHMNYIDNGIEIFEKCFEVGCLPKSSTSLTRYWNKYYCRSINETLLQNMSEYFLRPMLSQAGVNEDSLRFDSTVMTRYGNQEGAEVGYNPKIIDKVAKKIGYRNPTALLGLKN